MTARVWLWNPLAYMVQYILKFKYISLLNSFSQPIELGPSRNAHVRPKNYYHCKFHIKTLQIYQDITIRGCKEVKYIMDMKICLRTQYDEDKKGKASVRCSLLLRSWDQILWRCPKGWSFICTSHVWFSAFPRENNTSDLLNLDVSYSIAPREH